MPKKETTTKKAASKEKKAPAKSTRDYSIAEALPKRLRPEKTRRVSKPVIKFTEATESKEVKPIVVPKGKGKKFADIPNIVAQINKRTRSDDLLKTVHQLLLGRVGKGVDVKENLESFNGVNYGEDERGREKLEAKLSKLKMKPLREIAAFFGQDPEGERDDLVQRIADFLEKPKPSDKVYKLSSPKKRSRSSSRSRSRSRSSSPARKKSKKSKKDPNEPKRPLSGYMFFCKDARPDVVKKNPDAKVTEVAKILGRKWTKLSSSEKKKYTEKQAKDKARYEKEMKKYKKE